MSSDECLYSNVLGWNAGSLQSTGTWGCYPQLPSGVPGCQLPSVCPYPPLFSRIPGTRFQPIWGHSLHSKQESICWQTYESAWPTTKMDQVSKGKESYCNVELNLQ